MGSTDRVAGTEQLECGHLESAHSSVTRGYGTDRDGKRYCYACCLARDQATIDKGEPIIGYLSSDKQWISNWPGGWLFRVASVTHPMRVGFGRRIYSNKYDARSDAETDARKLNDGSSVCHADVRDRLLR